MFDDSKPALFNVLRWASRPTDDADLHRFLKGRLLVYVRLEALILACLAKDPNKRPHDAEGLMTMLSDCEGESPFGAAEARSWWSRLRKASPRAA